MGSLQYKICQKISLNIFYFSLINAGCIVVLWYLENGDYFPIQNLESVCLQRFVTIEGHMGDKYTQIKNICYKFTDIIKTNKI
ncbi:hypothetical protein DRF60_06310 [Chryseobacterium elymi]|uniref:Uncharacterized protein n=1 Tax=Chryseobacterium elymi TaxID=395936 RepID=A0A3D9DN58_9FLAO|nr:hypothetical protein DRF60_06310 [Chryseobacterium elymi]